MITMRVPAGILAAGSLFATVFAAPVVVTTDAEAAVPRSVRIHCKRDYKTFCPRYKIDSSRARRCISANRNNLSPVCQKVLVESGYARR